MAITYKTNHHDGEEQQQQQEIEPAATVSSSPAPSPSARAQLNYVEEDIYYLERGIEEEQQELQEQANENWLENEQVEEILRHDNRKKSEGIYFFVKWNGVDMESWIKAEEALKHPRQMRDYIQKTMDLHPRRIPALMKRVPGLRELIRNRH